MPQLDKKVNFQENSNPKKKKKDSSQEQGGRKRTIYEIGADKLNLVEVRRKINKQQIKFDQNQKHIKELYNLGKIRLEAKEELSQLKQKEEEEQLSKFKFQPKIDKNSKKLAEKILQEHPEIIERQNEWLKQKNEKMDLKKQQKEKQQQEKELHHAIPLPKPKTKYQVTSKVKQRLEQQPDNYKNAQTLVKAVEKLRNPTPTKKNKKTMSTSRPKNQ